MLPGLFIEIDITICYKLDDVITLMSRRALPTLRQSQLTTIDFIKPNFLKYLVQREKKSENFENI